MDRIQAIERGRSIYQGQRCRTSFGVVVRERYDELRHRGQKVTVDPLDKMKWADDQIDWLVKQVNDAQCPFERASLTPYRVKKFRMRVSNESTG
jgi:hypothetical protein